MRQRALASTLTGLSMALGVAVMICVIVIHSVAVRQFKQDAQGYHVIIGSSKGSPTDVVLSTVFHVGKSLYPFSYSYYREFTDGKFANQVDVAVPYCLGDSYVAGGQVFRVVATTPDLFDKIQYGATDEGEPLRYQFQPGGRNFKIENCHEAVIGSVVAAQANLKVGDLFNPTHGIGPSDNKHNAFKIVGVLAPTGTSNDRALFVNIEGFFLIADHALSAKDPPTPGEMAIIGASVADRQGLVVGDRINTAEQAPAGREIISILTPSRTALDDAIYIDNPDLALATGESEDPSQNESHAAPTIDQPRGMLPPAMCYDNDGNEVTPLPEAQREVTSILVLCTSSLGPMVLDGGVNKDPTSPAQAVAPTGVVTRLLEGIIGPVQVVLMVLTVLIVIVAAISILVSIYNSMSERSHDIAVMRALGASRTAVMLIILFESILLSLSGGLAGIVLGHALVGVAAPYVVETTGVRLDALQFDRLELMILPALGVLASLVGLLPALAAYRTDVARSLSGGR